MMQQNERDIDRAFRLQSEDTTTSMELPLKDSREIQIFPHSHSTDRKMILPLILMTEESGVQGGRPSLEFVTFSRKSGTDTVIPGKKIGYP